MRTSLPLAVALLAGCGGKLTLDESTVAERLDRIEADVPLCTTGAAAPSDARVVARELAGLRALARQAGAAELPLPPFRSAGSCGGTLDTVSEHDNGVTDFDLTFTAFCVTTAEGQLVLDGRVVAREQGTPSDYGPIVSAFEASTDGPLAVTHGDQAMEISVDTAHVQYGLPDAWSPLPPDAENPDRIVVEEIALAFPNAGGRVDYARGLQIERVGGSPATLTVRGGELGTEGEGRVEAATAPDEPIVIDAGALQVTSGALVLTGAGGTELVVRPDGLTPGVLDLTLDGEPYARGIDCSAGRGPLAEVGLALLLELGL